MKAIETGKIFGAMFAAVIAGCATFANAQTNMNVPEAGSSQREAVAVSSHRSRPDSALVRDVRRAFTRTPGLNFANVHVAGRNGVITLTGSVPQRSQIGRAGNAARSVRGVRGVSNRLTVRTSRGSGR
ncbi:BON domain-containing protein [Paraburkholderia lycopersici]|uniref:BON domain-containing protein n=1 Tax=Paraburkholderia lycopersici TaxID=416944 RepID=A0A1G6HFX2_9BURK|nr:BON domain-containing protein [Paraburkholderia lycopersici]SDB92336.1 BON domain-containing protein [Paraburkholderia lycopersici]